MCIIHKWRTDRNGARTCVKCELHQLYHHPYYSLFGYWVDATCDEYMKSISKFDEQIRIEKKRMARRKVCGFHNEPGVGLSESP